MGDFLVVFGKISYVVLIIGSIVFGITMAVQVYVSSIVKRLLKNSRENFDKILDLKSKKECLKVINFAKKEIVLYVGQSKKPKKAKGNNKENFTPQIVQKHSKNSVELKDILFDLFKGTASVFSNYGGRERGYLSFTEREIFSSIDTLKKRVEEIIDNSGVIWLKTLNVSTILIALDTYKSFEDFKGKFWVSIFLKVIDFFLWIGRVISPIALTKYILKEFSSDNLSDLLKKSFVEICGKELSYIYYEKSLVKKEKKDIEVA